MTDRLLQLRWSPWLCLLLALVSAVGMWLYTTRILIPYQVATSAAHGKPRGNLSDLFPRWIGARELLLHGRDPYSHEMTVESQKGYYGRPLDPSRPEDPNDEQGFAYPVYVVFLLAPLIHLPFVVVQKAFFWFLLLVTLATILFWLRIVRIHPPLLLKIALMILVVGSFPVVQGLKLQQMTLLVAGLIAGGVALLVSGYPILAGILLAFGTIKPQLMWLLVLWLGLWTLSDWRRRYRWAVSFLLTMLVLFAASEWYLPHWLPRFWRGLGEYLRYTRGTPVVDVLVPGWVGTLLSIFACLLTLGVCWKNRHEGMERAQFVSTLALVLAMTVLLVPSFAPYNQVLLLPAILLLVRDWNTMWRGGLAARVLFFGTSVVCLWPWLSSVIIGVLSFLLPPQERMRFWTVPFWAALPLPIGVAALMLVYTLHTSIAASTRPGTA